MPPHIVNAIEHLQRLAQRTDIEARHAALAQARELVTLIEEWNSHPHPENHQ